MHACMPHRWFRSSEVEIPVASHLDLILYSREQLVKEYEDLPAEGKPEVLPEVGWGIISIKVRHPVYQHAGEASR
jgi:hypothetical protein